VGKLKSDEQGFSAVEVILVLVIVVLIGAVGFLVYKNHNKTTKASVATTTTTTKPAATTPTKTTTPASTTTQPATGTVIKSADGKVAITLPTDYKMTGRTDGGSTCGFAPSSPAPGTCISDISYQQGSNTAVGGYVKIFKTTESASDWHNATFGDCGSPQNTTVGSNPELICTINPDGGKDYTVSNGEYVAYFASDSSAESLAIISSVQFL